MKKISSLHAILLAVASGIVTGFVFPTMFAGYMLPNLGFLAWVSLVPLFVAISVAPPRKAFLLAFITGFIYCSISMFWLYNALTVYGKLSVVVSIGILFLMMVILGSLIALAPAFTAWAKLKGGASIYILPIAWVAVEVVRNYFPFGGCPWNNIVYSQAGYPLLIQTADIFGIYGISFLIIMINQFFADMITKGFRENRTRIIVEAAVVLVIFAMFIAYGWYRLETVSSHPSSSNSTRIALVQGNIPQDEKWDNAHMEKNLNVYRSEMKKVEGSSVSLVVWPESADPYLVPMHFKSISAATLGFSPQAKDKPWLLFGALSVDIASKSQSLYNSAILVDPNGIIMDRYHKMHLVPFGEYVPFKKLLFFAKKLVEPVGNFMEGASQQVLKVKDYIVGPLICYEDVFPEISRGHVRGGANILINLTNDAWYGRTSGPFQHLGISTLRAVENRRFMLRSTNTGVTAVVDPLGKVELKSDIFTLSLITAVVPILTGQTFYNKYGSLTDMLWIVLAFVVFVSAIGHRKHRHKSRKHFFKN